MTYTQKGPFTDGSGSPGLSAAFANGIEAELATGWTGFTATLGGVTVGNGTFSSSRWRTVGSALLYVIVDFSFGSTTAITGAITVSLPGTAVDSYGIFTGQITIGGIPYDLYPHHLGTSVRLRTRTVSGTAIRLNDVTATVPATWATGDKFEIHGLYRV